MDLKLLVRLSETELECKELIFVVRISQNAIIIMLLFFYLYFIDRSRKNLEETGAYVDADIDSPVSSTKSDSDANHTSATRGINSIQKKDVPSQVLSNRRKSDMEISQASNSGEDSPLEGSSVVHTKLPPGKVNIFLSLYLLYIQGIEEMKKLIPLTSHNTSIS